MGSPWVWSHPPLRLRRSLVRFGKRWKQDLRQVQHDLRESWRHTCWTELTLASVERCLMRQPGSRSFKAWIFRLMSLLCSPAPSSALRGSRSCLILCLGVLGAVVIPAWPPCGIVCRGVHRRPDLPVLMLKLVSTVYRRALAGYLLFLK